MWRVLGRRLPSFRRLRSGRQSRLTVGALIAACGLLGRRLPIHLPFGRAATGDFFQGLRAATANVTGQEVPEDIANAVCATAAESLLMGIFVIICAFELRDERADNRGKSYQTTLSPMSMVPVHNLTKAPGGTLRQTPAHVAEGGGGGVTTIALSASGTDTPKQPEDDEAGSLYQLDDAVGMQRQLSTIPDTLASDPAKEYWQPGPLLMMMILLHVVYPSFPISPQVELGRILTFLGFLCVVGTRRCIAVIDTAPIRWFKVMSLTLVGVFVHTCISFMTDTISDLIFPSVGAAVDLYQGPRYLHNLLLYLAIRYPTKSASLGLWAAWCIVSAVVFTSAVWKEFLFRGVYLGGLRTQMPFWVANLIVGCMYALAHEPLSLSDDGTLRFNVIAGAPLLMGSMWYGYLYHQSGNITVTVISHLIFNAMMFWLHLLTTSQSQ